MNGPNPLRVFSLTTGADTGGWAGRMADAFAQHPEAATGANGGRPVRYRQMCNSDNYIQYPYDLAYDKQVLQATYDAADVVHLHNSLHGHDFYDDGQGKPTVLIHHGTPLREDPGAATAGAIAIGAVQICSTIDLEQPGIPWVPVPYELDGPISTLPHRGIPVSFMRLRADALSSRLRFPASPEAELVWIGHAPTDRSVKSTEAFLAAVDSLAECGLPVKPVLIEGKPHAECLGEKAACDIFVDQLHLGYGCNAVEAWAMGIPVVVGVDDPVVRSRMLDRWGSLPFAEASEATLEAVLARLVQSHAMRHEYAEAGLAHVRRWHDAAKVVPVLTDLYRSAPMTKPGGSLKRSGPIDDREAMLAMIRYNRAQGG